MVLFNLEHNSSIVLFLEYVCNLIKEYSCGICWSEEIIYYLYLSKLSWNNLSWLQIHINKNEEDETGFCTTGL